MFSGPIISEACKCPGTAPGIGCVLDTFQNIMNLAFSLAGLIAIVAVIYAGIMFITTSANPEGHSKAKGMLMNVIIGFVILAAAWLIVDFVMKALYNPETTTSNGVKWGPWNSLLGTTEGQECLVADGNKGLFSGGFAAQFSNPIVVPTQGSAQTQPSGTHTFTYQKGIQAQSSMASAELSGLLSCMSSKLPAGVGQISSISDSLVVNGSRTMQQCAGGGCAHSAGSCHYGGESCIGRSYAVDFGDENNAAVLTKAAKSCGATYTGFEGDHLHVSIGAKCGCN